MIAFILRRIGQSVVVLLVTGLVAFSLFRFVGDPVEQILGQERTVADIERVRDQLGLNDPFPVQYADFLGRALQGDFGISYRQGRPAMTIIIEKLPATLELALVSGIMALVLGIVFGVYTALKRDAPGPRDPPKVAGVRVSTLLLVFMAAWCVAFVFGWLPSLGIGPLSNGLVFALVLLAAIGLYVWLEGARVVATMIMTGSLIGVSLPTFLIGILLIWIFAVELKVLPSNGRGQTVDLGWWRTGLLTTSGLKSLILPAITLGLYQMTLIMRLVRAEMLETLRADYVRFAWARGLAPRSVHFRHALKNTLVPVITITGLQLGSIIAFAIITETVFAWPGVGAEFIRAVQFVDIPVMITYLMLVAVLFVFINLVVDLLYFVVDPRLRT